MPNIGTPELIVILLILLLLFGSKKLPELTKSIGSSIKEFRKGLKEDNESEKNNKEKSEKRKN